MIICAPPLDERPWPTLGPQVCQFIEENLVFGPGDLRGQPARLDDEKRGLIYRMYEVYPKNSEFAGRRRFRRCALSLQKGAAKTELGAWIAAVELHPEGPVRCDGFRGREPVGRPVMDPYIPMLAYTEEQSEELAYYALKAILEESPIAGDFDIGLERIMRRTGDGKATALAGAPSARDGARTTFEFFDETHHWTLPRLLRAHDTMLQNLLKRPAADPWALEATTAPAPGEGSVAEKTMEYGLAVAKGDIKDGRIFFFHRQASDGYDLAKKSERRAAVIEAAGPTAAWKDIDGIVAAFDDPQTDKAYWERVWMNRLVQRSDRAFDLKRWNELAQPGIAIPDGAVVTAGFDGARYHDATALVIEDVATAHIMLVGLWEKPLNAPDDWTVPELEVDALVDECFRRWDVVRLYADPYWWESWLARWAGRYGEKKVVEWRTNRVKPMAYAVKAFATAIQAGEVSHDGNEDLARHIGNCCRKTLNFRDEDGQFLWWLQKEEPHSPRAIDAASAAVLAHEARNDALAAGVTAEGEKVTVEFW